MCFYGVVVNYNTESNASPIENIFPGFVLILNNQLVIFHIRPCSKARSMLGGPPAVDLALTGQAVREW
jgi:hypothetical protein